jgi:N-acyl-D-aspartate/D-glutamate deacylase
MDATLKSLAEAAELGAQTSAILSAIAREQAEKIDKNEPMEDPEKLQAISALMKMANDAAALGMSLASKINKPLAEEKPRPKIGARFDLPVAAKLVA